MKVYLFYHSVISDWNNGNAHFLRGIISSLNSRGHNVKVLEPENGWSLKNLMMEQDFDAYGDFKKIFPHHTPILYPENRFEPGDYIADADLVIVHEWNYPEVVKKIGSFKNENRQMILLFHDTHHRSVTMPEEMQKYDLRFYDGVLAFGEVIKQIYLKNGWSGNVWTWHEAADTSIFHPVPSKEKKGDLVWIGNWGDDERTSELYEYIIDPVRELGLKACFYGVRYPKEAVEALQEANIDYKGWLPNYRVPDVFSQYNVTVHVPRRPYVTKLKGIPTIRPFEALACGIPLICSPWYDTEHLFTPGKDYLVALDKKQMKRQLIKVLTDKKMREKLISSGLNTIRTMHTCDHRVDGLMKIIEKIKNKRAEKKFADPVRAEL
jgi:spore maturation protein CgeB